MKTVAMIASAIVLLLPVRALAAPDELQRDAVGSRRDVTSFCSAITAALRDYGHNRETEFRHIVVIDDYAVGTVRLGVDVFNVTSARLPNGWTAPYVVGPAFPAVESLTATGMPDATATAIFAALQRLNAVPPAERKAPC